MHFLKSTGLPCAYVVLGDEILDLTEAQARVVLQEFKSRVVREQAREELPPYWLCVLESTGGLHGNFVFPVTRDMLRKLKTWEAFSAYLKGKRAIQRVYDHESLVRNYLAKERPPNVRGGSVLGPRLKGSHKLGEGGGDRVQLSSALRRDAIAVGLVEPWQRTTSKNLTTRPPHAVMASIREAAQKATDIAAPAEMSGAVEAITPARFIIGSQSEAPIEIGSEANDAGAPAQVSGAGQDEADRLTLLISVVEGPRNGIGWDRIGHGAQSECPSCPVEPLQLPLFAALPLKPPPFSVGTEVRELRQRTGLSQERLAGQIGIRDRSHLANVERGHDRLSPQRRRLLRYIADTRLAA